MMERVFHSRPSLESVAEGVEELHNDVSCSCTKTACLSALTCMYLQYQRQDYVLSSGDAVFKSSEAWLLFLGTKTKVTLQVVCVPGRREYMLHATEMVLLGRRLTVA